MKALRLFWLTSRSIPLFLLLALNLQIQKLKRRIFLEKQKKVETLNEPKKEKQQKKTSLPPFPENETMKGEARFIPGDEEEATETLAEICKDVVSVLFEVWSILKPGVPPLSEIEKSLIKKPLARLAIKYNIGRLMKDELLAGGLLAFFILKRLKTKKDVKDDSGEKGERKDDAGKNAGNGEPGN